MSALFDYIVSWWVTPQEQNGVEADNVISKSFQNERRLSLISPTDIINVKLNPLKADDVISKSFHNERRLSLISPIDLVNVKLNPVKDIIPAPARNMPPLDKFTLNILNQAQLRQILSVKLKPIKHREKIVYYEPRHPVLKELLQKIKKII